MHKVVIPALNDKNGVERAAKEVDNWKKTAGDPHTGRGSDVGQPENDARAQALWLLESTDTWLREREDRPVAADFIALRSASVGDTNKHVPVAALHTTRVLLCDWLLALWVKRDDAQLAALLTRRLLILDLLDATVLPDAQIDSLDVVWSRLHRRNVVMHPSTAAAMLWEAVDLVRGVKVDDLYVIRSEWSCYKAGEIASITNVLAGESYAQEVKELREEEIIQRQDEEVTESTEKLEEEKTQTELSKEIERAASLQVGIAGSVDVSGQYGVTKFGASASASTAISLSENNRQASRTAREMTSRAVAKVESRVREERIHRLLTKTMTKTGHEVRNDTDEHVRGVYRWVDRVDRYQVFRYPNRLLLEFQIPEPATYLRYRLSAGAGQAAGGIEQPPLFDVSAEDLNRDNYTPIALKYRATNMPAPPDEELSVTHVIKAKSDITANTTRDIAWAAPIVQDSADIALPTGYVATSVVVSGSAFPMRQLWRTESRQFTSDKDKVEGFHRITAYVSAGASAESDVQAGTTNDPIEKDFTVQLPRTAELLYYDNSRSMYGNAVMWFNTKELPFDPYVTGKVTVGIHVSGASSAEIGFTAKCRPSTAAMAEWQNSVYDALLDAWRAWDQQYRTQQLAQGGPNLSGVNGRSPSRNKELVQEELKRQVIAWLMNDEGFAGIDAMSGGNPWERYSIAKARNNAAIIQFLEQAFEWGNLTFMLYDYFWARGGQWDGLADIEAADPEFARFLRSGSARVMLPARPDFEDAVHHWLLWGEPFLGEPMPLPGDPLFVAVATEIRDIKDQPAGGLPGDSWETRMGTTLLWLDDEAELPYNDARRLGLNEHAPSDPICTDD